MILYFVSFNNVVINAWRQEEGFIDLQNKLNKHAIDCLANITKLNILFNIRDHLPYQ